MIKGGTGGGKTVSGLRFEARVNLATVISKLNGYKVKGHEVYKNDALVAQLLSKNNLYKLYLEAKSINYLEHISKRLLPDEAILVKDTLYIIEMKFQFVAGSVDEKLQTCHFKKRQYTKLLKPAGIKVEYLYVLNDWFKKPEYKDVLDYIKEVGCEYYFNEIPLSKFGLNL